MFSFASHIDAMFRQLGTPAVYTPEGSDPVEILVIPAQPDEIESMAGGMQIIMGTSFFEVRKSEIADPQKGDRIQLNGETYTVMSDPISRDADRLIWTLSGVVS